MKGKEESFYCKSMQTNINMKDPIKNQSLYENITKVDVVSTNMG